MGYSEINYLVICILFLQLNMFQDVASPKKKLLMTVIACILIIILLFYIDYLH